MTQQSASSNQRIAKNTLFLYLRMIFIILVNLYTSRVILNTLGVTDFGIYSVVGGVVGMFSFLQAAMTTSTQRYLNFELGRGDEGRLNLVFSTSLCIHVLIALIVIVLSETIGLWWVLNKLVIPSDRMTAAIWVYQFAVLGSVVSIMTYPYMADIIAHEQMNFYAYISILDACLKLGIVYLLIVSPVDKLILYGALLFAVQLLILGVYIVFCRRHYSESRLQRRLNKPLFKEMSSFASWNLWGNLASILYSQGLTILLNMFFGPALNAARQLAVSVVGYLTQLGSGFQVAFNPQITKTYANNELTAMHGLVFRSCKFTNHLLFLLSLPVLVETQTILTVWLKTVPEYTAIFVQISLFLSIINAMANPLMNAAAATGKIKVYQSVVGGILLLIVPIAYIVLKMGGNPVSVYVVQLIVYIIAFVVRLLIVKPLVKFSIRSFLQHVLWVCLLVDALSLIVPLGLKYLLPHSVFSTIIVCLVSMMSVAFFAYTIGLTKQERIFINGHISSFVNRFRR